MQVKFEGKTYQFPDDATDDEIRAFLEGLAPANSGDDARLANRVSAMGGPKPQPTSAQMIDQIAQLSKGQHQAPAREFSDAVPIATGIAGNVVGGAAGGFMGMGAGPLGAGVMGVGGSLLGGEMGRLAGAYAETRRKNMDPQEASAYIARNTGADEVVLDAAGTLLFMAGGKVIGTLAKNTELGRAITAKLGGVLRRVPKAEGNAVKPGEAVFGEASKDLATSPADLQTAAAGAAQRASQTMKGAAQTRGQLTGEPGMAERVGRMADPAPFRRAGEEGDRALMRERQLEVDRLAGDQIGETPGHTLQRAQNTIEQQVKASVDPTYEKLSQLGKEFSDVVDVSGIQRAAKAVLARPRAGLEDAHRKFLEEVADVSATGKLSPADAHALQSRWQALSRSLTKADAGDSPYKADVARLAGEMRSALAGGLDEAATRVERQMEMFRQPSSEGAIEAARRAQARGSRAAQEAAGRPQPDMWELDDAGRKIEAADVKLEAALPESQKAMYADAARIDPRFPQELRDASKLVRDMHENVYSTTGAKALKAAETAGPEHVAAAIYRSGNTTSLKELDALHAFAKRLDSAPNAPAARRALLERAEKLGMKDELDMTRPLAAQVDEVRRGVRSEFFNEHTASVEALAALPEKLRKTKDRRSFEAMFPEREDRLMIERLSQWAQQQMRGRERAGGSGGLASTGRLASAGGAALLGFQSGSVMNALVGGTAVYLTPVVLAHMLTKPAYRATLGPVAAHLAAGSKGAGAGAAQAVQALIKMAKKDGYDITVPPAEPQDEPAPAAETVPNSGTSVPKSGTLEFTEADKRLSKDAQQELREAIADGDEREATNIRTRKNFEKPIIPASMTQADVDRHRAGQPARDAKSKEVLQEELRRAIEDGDEKQAEFIRRELAAWARTGRRQQLMHDAFKI